MAWTALSFSVGQVLTAAQMNNLQANFAAMAANETGAPDITSIDAVTITNATVTTGNITTANVTTCLATNLQDDNVVGSYIIAYHESSGTVITMGTEYAGSLLTSVSLGISGTAVHSTVNVTGAGTALSGTWKALTGSTANAAYYGIALFVRTA